MRGRAGRAVNEKQRGMLHLPLTEKPQSPGIPYCKPGKALPDSSIGKAIVEEVGVMNGQESDVIVDAWCENNFLGSITVYVLPQFAIFSTKL